MRLLDINEYMSTKSPVNSHMESSLLDVPRGNTGYRSHVRVFLHVGNVLIFENSIN